MSVKILLPPSEGKSGGGDGPAWRAGTLIAPGLDPARQKVADALVAYLTSADASPSKLLGASGPTLDEATAADLAVLSGSTCPAYRRYTGVVWEALDPGSLTRSQRSKLLVVSGLWGIVGAEDPIPAYRLKMSASLPGVGRLSRFWEPQLTSELSTLLVGATVFDLLPMEHSAAWEPSLVAYRRRVRVRFEQELPDGSRRTISHDAKALKGALARLVAISRSEDPAQLERFEGGNYRFDPSRSDLSGRDGFACFTRMVS